MPQRTLLSGPTGTGKTETVGRRLPGIIEADKNWCMDRDDDFRFEVSVKGPGTGSYQFGVWARPKN